MIIRPSMKLTRFAQLEPGELFILLADRQRYHALKTAPNDGSTYMVLLGPFSDGMKESYLVDEQPAPVLSLHIH